MRINSAALKSAIINKTWQTAGRVATYGLSAISQIDKLAAPFRPNGTLLARTRPWLLQRFNSLAPPETLFGSEVVLDCFPYHEIAPEKTILFFDATGTVLDIDRNTSTFSLRSGIKRSLAKAASQGFMVGLISGDPFSLLEPNFTKPFAYGGDKPIYLATELGAQVYELKKFTNHMIRTTEGFSLQEKIIIKSAIEESFSEVLRETINLEREMANMSGQWIDLAQKLKPPYNQEKLSCTFVSSKIQVSFYKITRWQDLHQKLMTSIKDKLDSKLPNCFIKINRGKDYLDLNITKTTKESALKYLLELFRREGRDTIIIGGDSGNDEELLFPEEQSLSGYRVYRFFCGDTRFGGSPTFKARFLQDPNAFYAGLGVSHTEAFLARLTSQTPNH